MQAKHRVALAFGGGRHRRSAGAGAFAPKLAEAIVLRLGKAGTVLATRDQHLLVRPPKVAVVSAVGAGDSFVGALTLSLAPGWTMADAVAMGVAAAASAVTTEATELCRRESTERYFDEVMGRVEEIA